GHCFFFCGSITPSPSVRAAARTCPAPPGRAARCGPAPFLNRESSLTCPYCETRHVSKTILQQNIPTPGSPRRKMSPLLPRPLPLAGLAWLTGFRRVPDNAVVTKHRFGRFVGAVGPGWHWPIPGLDQLGEPVCLI